MICPIQRLSISQLINLVYIPEVFKYPLFQTQAQSLPGPDDVDVKVRERLTNVQQPQASDP